MPLIRIGHSPDPDDAFMFYALTAGKVKARDIDVEHVLEDIESLNRRARSVDRFSAAHSSSRLSSRTSATRTTWPSAE